MPTLTVKNIPNEIYQRLRQRAEANRRSLNSEIIACIEQAVSSQAIDPEQVLASARKIRENTSHYKITEEEYNQAKNMGRP
jgi:antitoxin FitA